MSELFKRGGPHRVKKTGSDRYSFSIDIPQDSDGRTARECPLAACSPGYFKVKGGTGITGAQEYAYCPYCRHQAEPGDFATQEQIRYAKDVVMREAQKGLGDVLTKSLGLGPSGKKKLGGGMVSMELSYKPERPRPVRLPAEDEVRRDIVCPHCTLDQTVFGLATWCSDCGEDIFLTHVDAELVVTRLMVEDIERRRESLGNRVAAKDMENCLEDIVSTFEAALKAIARRALGRRMSSAEQIDAEFRRIGNSFQSVARTRQQLSRLFDFELESSPLWDRIGTAFEKRHPITHNLGVVDRRYLEKVQRGEQEGREIRITIPEIMTLLDDVSEAVSAIYAAPELGLNSDYDVSAIPSPDPNS